MSPSLSPGFPSIPLVYRRVALIQIAQHGFLGLFIMIVMPFQTRLP